MHPRRKNLRVPPVLMRPRSVCAERCALHALSCPTSASSWCHSEQGAGQVHGQQAAKSEAKSRGCNPWPSAIGTPWSRKDWIGEASAFRAKYRMRPAILTATVLPDAANALGVLHHLRIQRDRRSAHCNVPPIAYHPDVGQLFCMQFHLQAQFDGHIKDARDLCRYRKRNPFAKPIHCIDQTFGIVRLRVKWEYRPRSI